MLRFDGIYSCMKHDYNMLLRFYEDGLVIAQSIGSGETKSLSKLFPSGTWFGRKHDDSGKYELDENSIKFSCCSSYGQVDYSGTVVGESLYLNIHSHINGFEESRRYVFYSDEVIKAIKAQ